jgi:hypothetical protein
MSGGDNSEAALHFHSVGRGRCVSAAEVQSLVHRFGLDLPQPLSVDALDLSEEEAKLCAAGGRRSLCARLGSWLCCGCLCSRSASTGTSCDDVADDSMQALAASELDDAHVRVVQRRCQSLFVAVEEAVQRFACLHSDLMIFMLFASLSSLTDSSC